MLGWIALAIVVVVLLVGVALFYNRFVSLRQQVRAAYLDIDVQLKRRHDLIPNLIETVKGYAAHERGVFNEVTKARADAIAAGAEPPAEQAVEKARLVVERVRDVERRCRLVGHFERLLVGGDLAKGIGETGRVTGEQRAGSIGHVLSLARHGELNELGDDGRENGKY